MKWTVLFSLLLLSSSVSATDPQPIHLLQLANYFQQEGISYQSYGTFFRTTKAPPHDPTSYVFLDYQDPGDEQTIGIFFEFQLHGGLTADENMHLAAGLRGPIDSSDPLTIAQGRGVGIGQLWLHEGCLVDEDGDGVSDNNGPTPNSIRGFFIEDWGSDSQGGDIHASVCEEIYMPDWSAYRVDLHVSRLNVYVAVWRVVYNYFLPPTYVFVGDHSCLSDGGDWCEEQLHNKFTGNGFITVAGSPGQNWVASNVFVAHWDN